MLKALLIAMIRGYQVTLGRIVGGSCRFHPTCSEYAIAALRGNGAARGSMQALWRLARCGPWTAGGIDHPKQRGAVSA